MASSSEKGDSYAIAPALFILYRTRPTTLRQGSGAGAARIGGPLQSVLVTLPRSVIRVDDWLWVMPIAFLGLFCLRCYLVDLVQV